MIRINLFFPLFILALSVVSCGSSAQLSKPTDLIQESTETKTLLPSTATFTQKALPTITLTPSPTPSPTPTDILTELWGSPYMVQKSLSAEGFTFGPISIHGINEAQDGFLFIKKENGDLFDMNIQTTLVGPKYGITYTKTFICLPHPFTTNELNFASNFVHIFWENIFAPGIWSDGIIWVDNTLASIQFNTEQRTSYGEYSARINLAPGAVPGDDGVCYILTVWVTSLWDE